MKPPLKFLFVVLGVTGLLSMIFLIHPGSLSPRTGSAAPETSAPPSPDFDGSGTVDFPDFLMFAGAFGSEEGQDNYDTRYDLNRDGKIAFEDFQILAHGFGKTFVARTPPESPKISAHITPASSPDLIVESPAVSDSLVDPGASFTLSVTVRNQGAGASPSLTRLDYYLSTDETISTTDKSVGWDLVSRLAASETSNESVRVRAAPRRGGTYYYGACIEAVSGESNTDNNCSGAVTVTVGSPDLIVESLAVSDSSLKAREHFTLSATVRNQGNGGTIENLITLKYYLSTDETISTSDTQEDWDFVGRIAANQTIKDTTRVLRAPSNDGTYYYGACIEAASGESNTDNNCSGAVAVSVGDTTPPPAPNQPPTFSEGTSATRSMAENTDAGQNVGNPVSATDSDGDRLTYSLEGRDAAVFTIRSNTGQLMTRSGETYDYETKNSYLLTLRAQDGRGGSATIAVTITLTDENEAPGRPAAPTVMATTSNSLRIRWTAPANSGPAVNDYDVRYRTGDGSFTDWPHTGASMTATITGLSANTRYEAQVRATNDEGTGDWSPSAAGTTGRSGGGGGGGNNANLIVETPQPLTEATLNGRLVTLTLTGAAYERSVFDVKDNVKVSGIAGVSVGAFGVRRVSDTAVSVELDFNGNLDTDSELTFTVEADAIARYNGPALTAALSVSAVEESVVASTPRPLTEATLNGSVVTLTLTGRFYVGSVFDLSDHVKVSGVAGVSVATFGIRRVSSTVVTLKLDFNGNLDADGALTFTVGADAISGYNGPALTATLPVTSVEQSRWSRQRHGH